jgi:Lon protease-like protein
VEFFEDVEGHSSVDSLSEEVAALYRKVVELGAKVNSTEEADAALPESPNDLSYMVSYVLDIDSEDKQKLLEMTSTAERLRALIPYLDETIQKLEQQIAQKELMHKVRGNGDLGKPKNL